MDRRKSLWIKLGIPVAVAVVFLTLFLIGKVIDADKFQHQGGQSTQTPYIEIVPLEGEQLLVGELVTEWLNGEESGKEFYNKYSEAGRIYTAKLVTVQYAIYDIPANVEVESQLVELSENSSFENAQKFELAGSKRKIQFEYLYTNRTYYYRITAKMTDGSEITASGQFKTADTPRIISTEGVWNMRDIGGIKTVDGKTVKQGMVYRGVELDGAVYEKYCITEAGVRILTEQLGIKAQFDLRAPNDRIRDMLGPDVKHTVYGVYAYSDSLVKYYLESYRLLFSDFAKAENYPAYVHCTYGKDRTGTVIYLLQTLIGVSEEDAYREWEMSALLDGVVDYPLMEDYIEALKQLEGDTMQEKVETFLLSCGVTQEEINSIREILLED